MKAARSADDEETVIVLLDYIDGFFPASKDGRNAIGRRRQLLVENLGWDERILGCV